MVEVIVNMVYPGIVVNMTGKPKDAAVFVHKCKGVEEETKALQLLSPYDALSSQLE